MSKNLFITSTEESSGKSLIVLGIMEMLLRTIDKVGFFRPIINGEGNGASYLSGVVVSDKAQRVVVTAAANRRLEVAAQSSQANARRQAPKGVECLRLDGGR